MLDEVMLDKGRFSRREFGSAVEELVSVFGESAVFDPYSGFQPTQLSFS